MIVKTATQVKMILFIIAGTLGILFLPIQASAGAACSESWQPENPHTCGDDLLYGELAESLAYSIQALEKTTRPELQLGEHRVSTSRLKLHYIAFLDYLQNGHTPQEITRYLEENFIFSTANPILITGYYEPIVPASLLQTSAFPTPLYTRPTTTGDDMGEQFKASRADIENTDALHGYEVAYVADVFTAFTIHIQGSALLTFNDGTLRQIHYLGNNGRKYTSVGRVLLDQNKIKEENMSMQAIKSYLHDHPQETDDLLQTNERFIYFTLSEPVTTPQPPSGSLGVPLTPERSVALDPLLYPPGILLYIQGTLPVPIPPMQTGPNRFHRRAFGRFAVHQDSGSAIKGNHRLDLFMGRGARAETMAGEMQEKGCLRILLPK